MPPCRFQSGIDKQTCKRRADCVQWKFVLGGTQTEIYNGKGRGSSNEKSDR